VARHVALAVAKEAQHLGLAERCSEDEMVRRIQAKMWTPEYLPYRRKGVRAVQSAA
jgi:malate dehydrogenase (oxaloacetate-decarboxylating)